MRISRDKLGLMMDWTRFIVFPEYAEKPTYGSAETSIADILDEQISVIPDIEDHHRKTIVEAFLASLPEISRLLWTDAKAVMHNDPAVKSMAEVVICYPVITVMLHYRVAHSLHSLGVPVLPRVLTEMAHSATGVDIHPAAQIGEYFAIDHGTGIVVGATSIIGNHVMLYQGVTLGAKNFSYDESGQPIDKPRHPILEDNVTVYSNASILGRIRIGHDSIVGGNVWLTHDVAPHSRVLQGHSIEERFFTDGAGI